MSRRSKPIKRLILVKVKKGRLLKTRIAEKAVIPKSSLSVRLTRTAYFAVPSCSYQWRRIAAHFLKNFHRATSIGSCKYNSSKTQTNPESVHTNYSNADWSCCGPVVYRVTVSSARRNVSGSVHVGGDVVSHNRVYCETKSRWSCARRTSRNSLTAGRRFS